MNVRADPGFQIKIYKKLFYERKRMNRNGILFALFVTCLVVSGCSGLATTDVASSDSVDSAKTSAIKTKERPKLSCSNAEIEWAATMVGLNGETRLSPARHWWFSNFLSRIGRMETNKAGNVSVVFRGISIDNEEDLCGGFYDRDVDIHGVVRMDIAISRTESKPYVFRFAIFGAKNEASMINGVAFGRFFSTVCIASIDRYSDGSCPVPSAEERAKDRRRSNFISDYATYCSLGVCSNKSTSKDFGGGEENKSLEAYTRFTYKNHPAEMASVVGLPFEMKVIVDELSGKNKEIKAQRTREFLKEFSVKVVKSSQSAARSTTAGGVLSSSAGSCRDMTKEVLIKKIKPAGSAANINIKLNFTLYRTYSPYAIKEKGDPISTIRSYTLNSANKYSVSDTVKFDCVLVSGRYNFAGQTMLGAAQGKSKKESDVKTTLASTNFDFVVE